MKSRLFCNRVQPPPVIERRFLLVFLGVMACILAAPRPASAGGDAPQWMHAVVNAPLPAHDEKTEAVLLYSETNITVLSADKIKTQVREAYKILRQAAAATASRVFTTILPGRKSLSCAGGAFQPKVRTMK